jgi:transposase
MALLWSPVGTRPEVAAQLIREYIYLYGAVSLKDGCCVYLIMPTSNTECFQAFLDVLARRFVRQDILLVLDGAPNHRCSDLAVPGNVTLLYLPPYSPELSPKENLWDEVREKRFKNYALKSMDAVRQAQAGHPLHRTQPRACPLHHVLSRHHQLSLM